MKLIQTMRIRALWSFLICALSITPIFGANTEVKQQRPNIIFIFTDDQPLRGMGHIDPFFHTPNMDRLAQEGVSFINGFVESSVCAVSRASTLMGQYNSRHGIQSFDTALRPEQMEQSFPVLLRKAGYRTAFMGKFGVGHPRAEPRELCLPEDSFDLWYGFPHAPSYLQEIDGEQRYMTTVIEEKTIQFIKETPRDQPFMAYLCLLEPHGQGGRGSPWNLRDPEFEMPEPTLLPERPKTMTVEAVRSLPQSVRSAANVAIVNRPYEDYVEYMNTVRHFIGRMDLTLGRLREALERDGRADNTIIIFTSDNGSMWGAKGIAGKWNMYEESIRVPMIIYDPRLPESLRGGTREQMALNIDLTVSTLDFAGVPIPETMQGKSLVPILAKPDLHLRDDWYYLHDVHSRSRTPLPRVEGVRTDDFKYIHYLGSDPLEEELFDLRNDPLEEVNLINNPEYADILAGLRNRTEELRKHVK
jgi:arylsulfatase A-like enzyme